MPLEPSLLDRPTQAPLVARRGAVRSIGGMRAGLIGLAILVLGGGGASAGRPHADHRTLEQQAAASRVVALARCYGRFIGWRDELSGLMRRTGAYTPSSDAPGRFGRVEASFTDTALKDRHLSLHLLPTFAEKDFPRDIRRSFREGLRETAALFAARDYLSRQSEVLARPDVEATSRTAML